MSDDAYPRSALPSLSDLISVKHPKHGHSHRKPNLTTEPPRDIDPTGTEDMVRRLLEPLVDQAEEKKNERCAFPTLYDGVDFDAVIPLDM